MAVDAIPNTDRYAVTDTKLLAEAGELPILGEDGKTVPFKSLWTEDSAHPRQLVIFVRHFYCGLCEGYIHELNEHLAQSKLDTLNPPVRLTIIGCGELGPLPDYKKRTSCGFPIYCDPSRKVYEKLGMVVNLSMGGRKPDYLKASAFSTTISSAWNAITAGSKSLQAGNFAQNGGELLFEDGQLKWMHRMQNTRDHAEIKELQEMLKMESSESKSAK